MIAGSLMGQCPNKRWDASNQGSAFIEEIGKKTFYGKFTNAENAQFVNDGRLYFMGDIDNNGHLGDGFGYEYIKRCDDTRTMVDGLGVTEFNILDVENPRGVDLNTDIRIKSNLHFNLGIVHTDRNEFRERVFFMEGATYSGSTNDKHVDGTIARQGEGTFLFPSGDGDHLSPVKVQGENSFDVFIATYHSTLQTNRQYLSKGEFPVDSTDDNILVVQPKEFWTLSGSQSTKVTLYWTPFSDILDLTTSVADLVVVGWDGEKWVNLGNTELSNDFDSGNVSSSAVVPNRYEAFTFGVLDTDSDGLPDSQDSDPFDPCYPDANSEACLNRVCIDVHVNVFLEGALQEGGIGQYGDRMRTTLNNYGYLPGQRPITLLGVATEAGQPYGVAPWLYPGNEGQEFNVFGTGGSELYPVDAVDWVLISLRTHTNAESTVCTKSALLLDNGEVVLTDFFDCCDMLDEEYYVVVEHRNHLIVMTPTPMPIVNGVISYDFRYNQSYTRLFGKGQKEVNPGVFAMYSGNGDQITVSESTKDINSNDIALWSRDNGTHSGYYFQDYDLSGDVNVHDKAIWLTNNGVFTDVDR